MVKKLIKRQLVKHLPGVAWKKYARSQNDDRESMALEGYAKQFDLDQSFVEFGFHPHQFNSISLVKANFAGLLLDGDPKYCDSANEIFQKLDCKTKAVSHWIKRGALSPIIDFVNDNDGRLGVLNVDIDGNDYWILKELLESFKPDSICVEYNASFGLRSITVPYSDDFDRHKHHESGWYHGASISAFINLLGDEYALVENIVGLNLIFIRRDKLDDKAKTLTAETGYAESQPRNQMSGTTAEAQWEAIKHMPFDEV